MTIATTFATAISTAATASALDDLSRDLWRAAGAGLVGEEEAGRLSVMIHARRHPGSGGEPSPVPPLAARARSLFSTGRRPPRSPDRLRSRFRQRRLAASGPLPPVLASSFTTAELAALAIVADVCADGRPHAITNGELAARAGVSVSTVKRAVGLARRLGLLRVDERRRRLAPSLPNLLTILSPEWRTWLKRRGGRGSGRSCYRHSGSLKGASGSPMPRKSPQEGPERCSGGEGCGPPRTQRRP